MVIQRKKSDKKTASILKDYGISDGKTKVTPLTKEQKKYQKKSTRLKNPLLIAGFPGPGLVGSICANYIIQELNLHQIAYVESEYIMPGVIFVGGILRHPFRLYSDDHGNLCVLICEIPISSLGIYSVFNIVVRWAKKFGVREVIVLEGIPMVGIPASNRKSLMLSHDGKTIDSTFMVDLVDEKQKDNNDDVDYKEQSDISDDPDLSNIQEKKHYERPKNGHTAIIAGIAGGLLTACLSNGIACKGLIVPATANIPDPEAAAILIETINELHDNPLNIDVEKLKNKGKLIKKQLEEMLKTVLDQQNSQQIINKGTMYS
ncbi:MAG: PAC2 family protein [Thermoproteota archaeon]|nr:PAC2 family protein [Thermoproteota archaeon]